MAIDGDLRVCGPGRSPAPSLRGNNDPNVCPRHPVLHMKRLNVDQFENALRSAEAVLGRGLSNRDGIAVEKSPDEFDEAQCNLERELAARSLNRDSRLLADVKHALQRIKDGTLGTCQRCDGQIGPARMSAIPWARFCLRCQERIDQGVVDLLE